MYETRDECLTALIKDKPTFQQNDIVDIIYRPSTGAYHYKPHVYGRPTQFSKGENVDILYARMVRFLLPNQWDFRPISQDAQEYVERNPLPGTLIIGS